MPRVRTAAQLGSGAFLLFGSQIIAANGMIEEKVGSTKGNMK